TLEAVLAETEKSLVDCAAVVPPIGRVAAPALECLLQAIGSEQPAVGADEIQSRPDPLRRHCEPRVHAAVRPAGGPPADDAGHEVLLTLGVDPAELQPAVADLAAPGFVEVDEVPVHGLRPAAEGIQALGAG